MVEKRNSKDSNDTSDAIMKRPHVTLRKALASGSNPRRQFFNFFAAGTFLRDISRVSHFTAPRNFRGCWEPGSDVYLSPAKQLGDLEL
jgi:hypothetical protein